MAYNSNTAYAGSVPTQVPQMAAIPEQLGRLEEQTKELEMNLDTLEKQLAVVSIPFSTVPGTLMLDEKMPPASQITARLMDVNSTLKRLINKVVGIRQQLEV